MADEGGAERTYTIVGEDEADLSKGLLSFASPLARSLMKARVGDVVIWKRPAAAGPEGAGSQRCAGPFP